MRYLCEVSLADEFTLVELVCAVKAERLDFHSLLRVLIVKLQVRWSLRNDITDALELVPPLFPVLPDELQGTLWSS